MSRYLMGLDAGTTSFKGAIYDEQGVLVAVHQLDYTLLTPQADWVEYPAEAYWNHFCELTRSLLEKSGVAARDIEALAISSQGETLVCLDEAGEPLGNAIVWLDNRAAREADALRQAFGRRALYEHTGQADMLATWPAAKILWLRENQPARFARVKRFLLLEDWLLYRLTGRFVGEPNLWASSALINIHTGQWWPEMLKEVGLLPDRLPELLPCGAPAGRLLPAACRESGLHEGTLAVMGALDQTCNTIGAGVTLPGSVCETTGSCLAVSATLPEFVPWQENAFITCQNHAVPGRYTALLWSQSAGMVFKWFAKGFYPEFEGNLDAAFDRMNRDAAQVPAGCEGLLMLPHLSGASNPEFDPHARGVFFGATLQHSRAHFTRSIMEAVAFMLRRNAEQLTAMGASFDRMYCMGGASKSPLWLSIKASVTGCAMLPLRVSESACLGAARLAGVGAGWYADIDRAADALLNTGGEFLPDPALKPLYDRCFERYIALYEALKPVFAGA